jgi:uroporphyrinogen-III synthase
MTHWVTYSEPSASRLATTLAALGQSSLCEPVTRIEVLPLPHPLPTTPPDLLIALSQHAVAAYLANHYQTAHSAALTLAIGPATAAGLIEHGGFEVRQPTRASSEGLLAMPELVGLRADQTVWLLTGQGGRDLVAQALAERCKLQRLDLYRRQKRAPDFSSRESLSAIWVGSIHGLQQVDGHADTLKIDRQRTMLVAASARIADYAQRLAWRRLEVCEASDVQAVEQICKRINKHG